MIQSLNRELIDELKLRLHGRWANEDLRWEEVVRLLKDMLGITRPAVITALGLLKQGDSVPAPLFVDKFDRVVRELGEVDADLAKTYLVNALSNKTRQSLNDSVGNYVLRHGVGETREEMWEAVQYEEVKRILRSRDLFTGLGDKVDLGSYVNRGEEKKKGGGTVHTVVSETPPSVMDSGRDEEEYTGPRPL